MNVEIPLAPRRLSGSSVRTMIIMRSAVPAFVAHAVVLFGRTDTQKAELAELVDHVAREMLGAVPLGGEGLDLVARELARQLDDLLADVSRGRHRIPAPISCRAVLWPPFSRAAARVGTCACRVRPAAPS